MTTAPLYRCVCHFSLFSILSSPLTCLLIDPFTKEYFHQRVKIWLRTVGREIFGINHYWIRYEFAPSRGQIHAHLLAITGDRAIQIQMYQHRKDEQRQARLLAEWAQQKFRLTANFHEPPPSSVHPCAIRRSECKDSSLDELHLMKTLQLHQCSPGYCLRKSNKEDKQKYCENNATTPNR